MPQLKSVSLRRAASCVKADPPHRCRRAALAVLAVVSIGVAGCAKGSLSDSTAEGQTAQRIASATPAAAAAVTSERYETALERRGGKVRVTAVPSSYRPKISKAKALDSFKAEGVFPETAARETADVRLGLYTSDEMNHTWPPFYRDQPAWVIRYDHVPAEANPDPRGPARIAPSLKASDGPVNILVFIDADTGRYLNAVQDPVRGE